MLSQSILHTHTLAQGFTQPHTQTNTLTHTGLGTKSGVTPRATIVLIGLAWCTHTHTAHRTKQWQQISNELLARTLHDEGFVKAQIEVNQHFPSKEKGQEKESTDTNDCNTFEARGIVGLFSVPLFTSGHSDGDVGDVMSAFQRTQEKKLIRSQLVNTKQPLRLLPAHVHYSINTLKDFFLSTRVCACVSVNVHLHVKWEIYYTAEQGLGLQERENAREMPKAPCSSISEIVEGVERRRMDHCNLFFPNKIMQSPQSLEF